MNPQPQPDRVKPVTLISGFLGFGKTTFLNALLQYDPDKKFAVIEKEFGEEAIDGELIVDAGQDIYELSNGCLCCSLNEDFYKLLEELWRKRAQFDELIIETTGIADPAAVASPFLTSRSVPNYYQLQRVICLVDAAQIGYQLKETIEARQQISFADILLITKTDAVAPESLPGLQQLLKRTNPFARVLLGNKQQYPFDEIFAVERKEIVEKRPRFNLAPVSLNQHKHEDIVSLSFTFTAPFSITTLQNRLMAFLLFQASDVYRVKGIINAAGNDKKIIVQSVNANLVVEYGGDWPEGEQRNSRIVFIGKNLQPEGFARMLKQCQL